ncbi:MAG: hypothetical protein PVI98_05975 [Burkholderiales bacterium]|jgi:hypothetical protein
MNIRFRGIHRRFATALIVVALLAAGCTTAPQRATPVARQALTQTIYSDDGLSELSTPAGWAVRPDFSPDATIRVAKSDGSAYLIVNSYYPGEIEATPISEFSTSYMEGLKSVLNNSTASRGQPVQINGAEAHRFVVTGDIDDVPLTYVSTVIAGHAAMHHVVAWVAASDYAAEKDALGKIISSFHESTNPRPSRQRIALNFAWPHSMQSAVSLEQKSVKRGETSELKATYLNTVRPGNADELVVSTRMMRQKLTGLKDDDKNNYLNSLLDQLSSEIPDYVVSREGEFIRVDNLPAFRQRIENALVSSLPADLRDKKDKILDVIRPGLTEQFLAAAATDEWNKTVGGWIGSSYVPGQPYRFSENYYAPILGDTPFAMDVSRRIAGLVSCGTSATQCVKLVFTASVTGENFRSAMSTYLEKTVGEPVNVKHISVVKTIEIVAEPDTLIPHRSHAVEETTVTIEDGKGNVRTSRDTEDTRVTSSYENYRASL